MSIVVYPAVVDHVEGAALRGRFVDFPDLAVSAPSDADLLRAARQALTAELQRLERDGETWPLATALGDLHVPEGGTAVLVDVSVDDTPIRLTISLGERLLKRIDQDAQARSMTRSGYLALGARGLLDSASDAAHARDQGVGGDAGARLREEVEALGRRVTETLGPNSPIGRTLADLDAIALDGLRRLGGELRSAMGPRGDRTPGSATPDDQPGSRASSAAAAGEAASKM